MPVKLIAEKKCARCKKVKPLSEFYPRVPYAGEYDPDNPGHFTSECRDCLKERSKRTGYVHPSVPREETEQLALDYLHSHGIPAATGKSVSWAHTDVVAFGCVAIECKFATLNTRHYREGFVWGTTPSQRKDGFRADIVMLIADWSESIQTFYLFPADFAAFYHDDGRLKTGFTYVPGRKESKWKKSSRIVLVENDMEAAQNNIQLIGEALDRYCANLILESRKGTEDTTQDAEPETQPDEQEISIWDMTTQAEEPDWLKALGKEGLPPEKEARDEDRANTNDDQNTGVQ